MTTTRRIAVAAALVVLGADGLAAEGVAKKRKPCAAKHERAGCKLKTATWTGKNLRFAIIQGRGEAGGYAKIDCAGSQRNVIYGSYGDLVISNPKIGQTYTRTHPLKSPAGQFPTQNGRLKLTVKLTSASRATVTYDNQFTETGFDNVPRKCGGTVSETLKRK